MCIYGVTHHENPTSMFPCEMLRQQINLHLSNICAGKIWLVVWIVPKSKIMHAWMFWKIYHFEYTRFLTNKKQNFFSKKSPISHRTLAHFTNSVTAPNCLFRTKKLPISHNFTFLALKFQKFPMQNTLKFPTKIAFFYPLI